MFLLVAMVVLSGTFTAFLWRQVRYAKRDLEALRPLAARQIQEFNQKKPEIDAFLARLAEYGRTHPDFAAIFNKYNLAAVTGAPPATAPAPAPAAGATPAKPAPAAGQAPTPKPTGTPQRR